MGRTHLTVLMIVFALGSLGRAIKWIEARKHPAGRAMANYLIARQIAGTFIIGGGVVAATGISLLLGWIALIIGIIVYLFALRSRPSRGPAAGDTPVFRGDGTWIMYRGEPDKFPVLLRVDTVYKLFSRKSEYPTSIVVSIPYDSPSGNGFPTGPDNIDLQKLEDALNSALGSDDSCLVAAVTWNGSRDLHYYVKDSASANTALAHLANCGLYRQFRTTVTHDPNWDSVEQFLSVR